MGLFKKAYMHRVFKGSNQLHTQFNQTLQEFIPQHH
jgi:hypothetical protein